MSVSKKIIVVELNHRYAPIEVREVISAKADEIQLALENQKEEIPELYIVATCNWFSVYAYCETEQPILRIFKSFCNAITTAYLTILYDKEAIMHLFSTAAGLQSQTIGEHEILGQIRSGFALSNHNKSTGAILNELVNKAIHAGKRVRTETSTGKHAVSLAAITGNSIKRAFGDISGISVIVYGIGEMAQLVLKC